MPAYSQSRGLLAARAAVAAAFCLARSAPVDAQLGTRSPAALPAHAPAGVRRTRLDVRQDTVRVLFIGTSFTYYNNMPRLLEAIASSQGGPVVQTALAARGGATLGDHWSDSSTCALFRRGRWDWVVLNEQSTFGEVYLVDGQPRVHGWSSFADYATRWVARARQRGARVALLMHWANRDAPARDHAALDYAFSRVGSALHVTVVPAGLAWDAVRRAHPELPLYDADAHHPAPEGSYLAASTLYASLFGRNPVGATDTVIGPVVERSQGHVIPDSAVVLAALPSPEARVLQLAAWSAATTGPEQVGKMATRRPPPLALPHMPVGGQRPTPAELAGTWRGESTLYPTGGAAPTQIWIGAKGDHVWGRIRVVLGPRPDQVHEGPLAVTITAHGVVLSDPDGPHRGTVRYRGIVEDGVLHGVADFVVPDPMVHGIGTWAVRKD